MRKPCETSISPGEALGWLEFAGSSVWCAWANSRALRASYAIALNRRYEADDMAMAMVKPGKVAMSSRVKPCLAIT